MLSEFFTFLTTPCPPHIRHMGYLYEAIAMRQRYRRNRAAWQPHLEQSKKFVLASAEKCRDRSTAVVLGAGLLLDVPLDALASMFHEVVLLDIVILPEVRRTVQRYGNVKLIRRDVSAIAENLYDNIHRGIRDLPRSSCKVPEIDGTAGMVVSLNILSQLWVVPRSYALRKLPGLDEEIVNDWCGQIVEAHFTALQSMPCTVCLIADHEFVKRDRERRTISRDSTIAAFSLPEPDTAWTWDIVPLKESKQYASKELIVGAWHLR